MGWRGRAAGGDGEGVGSEQGKISLGNISSRKTIYLKSERFGL